MNCFTRVADNNLQQASGPCIPNIKLAFGFVFWYVCICIFFLRFGRRRKTREPARLQKENNFRKTTKAKNKLAPHVTQGTFVWSKCQLTCISNEIFGYILLQFVVFRNENNNFSEWRTLKGCIFHSKMSNSISKVDPIFWESRANYESIDVKRCYILLFSWKSSILKCITIFSMS